MICTPWVKQSHFHNTPDAKGFPFFKFIFRHHNKIRTIDGSRTTELVSVETLDLSNNDITDLRGDGFPAGLQIRDL